MTSGKRERLEMSRWILANFIVSICPNVVMDKLFAQSLGGCSVNWVKTRLSVQVGNGVKSNWGQAPVVSPRVKNWDQPCLISLQMTKESGSGGVSMFGWF